MLSLSINKSVSYIIFSKGAALADITVNRNRCKKLYYQNQTTIKVGCLILNGKTIMELNF